MKSMHKLLKRKKSKIGTAAKILLPVAGVIAAKKLWDKKDSLNTDEVRSKVLEKTEAFQEKMQQFHDFIQNEPEDSTDSIFADEDNDTSVDETSAEDSNETSVKDEEAEEQEDETTHIGESDHVNYDASTEEVVEETETISTKTTETTE